MTGAKRIRRLEELIEQAACNEAVGGQAEDEGEAGRGGEVAEVLDRTGADSERKKLLGQIENKLATIARLGRAFGIHLILATQRPDAAILAGQIRNNMNFRVCGRADKVLSQIILDSTAASEQIPKDEQGRFITGDGMVFQGFLFDESMALNS